MLLAIVVVLTASYLFFLVFAWMSADRIIFSAPRSSYTGSPDFFSIPAADETVLTCAHFPSKSSDVTILYLHGNSEDLGDVIGHLREMQRRSIAVFAFDYRGFGMTPGEPTEANLYADVRVAFNHLKDVLGVPPEKIVIYGRSLGSGPGLYLASKENVGGMILEGAFTSAFRVVTQIPLLPMDRFDNLARIRSIRCPILVIHAVGDRTVPFAHGRRLFAAANEPKVHFWATGLRHDEFIEEPGEEYWQALKSFLQRVETGNRPGLGA